MIKSLAAVLTLALLLTTQTVKAQTADVTAKIKAAVAGGALSISVDNDTLGGDPAVNIVKKLKVEYTIDGVASSKVAVENGVLTIHVSSDKKLVITKATYGDLPDKGIDVTDKLTAAIIKDALTISVDNDTLGGDPAPTIGKELRVGYTVKGVAHTATASENDTLNLPLAADGKGTLVIVKADYGVFQ